MHRGQRIAIGLRLLLAAEAEIGHQAGTADQAVGDIAAAGADQGLASTSNGMRGLSQSAARPSSQNSPSSPAATAASSRNSAPSGCTLLVLIPSGIGRLLYSRVSPPAGRAAG